MPKTINVGYQKRSGTYTGKLAYVIYYDEKGKLRKETSWNNWRDNEIPNEEFDNVPTEGFVLNKKVGGYSSGWNHRQTYCRIYDPRNFEFEITIENLLYILENSNSIKGKGLEGKFVYGWDGKDLVLLPVESPDYKAIKKRNDIIHNSENIKAKDLIVGATYITKKNQEMVYMGKYDYYSSGYRWLEDGKYKTAKKSRDIPVRRDGYGGRIIDYKYIENYPYGKYFWFATKRFDYDYVDGERINKTEYKWSFNQYPSVSGRFIKCIDSECTYEYADIFDVLESSHNYSRYDKTKDQFVDMTIEEFVGQGKGSKYSDGTYYYKTFEFISEKTGEKESYLVKPDKDGKYILQKYILDDKNRNAYGYRVGFEDDLDIFPTQTRETSWHGRKNLETSMIPVFLEEIYYVMKPIYIQCHLENGRKYKKEYSL